MNWTLRSISYYSHDNRRRTLNFGPGLNIITGSSGTGKSAILQSIDYCLCSSSCSLPALIKWRSLAVGCHWSNGTTEIFVARLLPRGSARSNGRVFLDIAAQVIVPETVAHFNGETNVEAAKYRITQLFGIGGVVQEKQTTTDPDRPITIRHAIPYIFLSKSVIDSDSLIFHGYDDRGKHDDYLNSLPYFLGAVDAKMVADERLLRQLRRALQRKEEENKRRMAAEEIRTVKARELLMEAIEVGLISRSYLDEDPIHALSRLEEIGGELRLRLETEDSVLPLLYERRQELERELRTAFARRRSAMEAQQLAIEFGSSVARQITKAGVVEHLLVGRMAAVCPVCNQSAPQGSAMVQRIVEGLRELRSEEKVVELHRPELATYIMKLDGLIGELRTRISEADGQIRSVSTAIDSAEEYHSKEALVSRIRGRISYFLQDYGTGYEEDDASLVALRERVSRLTNEIDPESKETRMRWAEADISRVATEFFKGLPTEEPLRNASLQFDARRPSIMVRPPGHKAVLQFQDVGSDQNYLAIHISIYLAMHSFFMSTGIAVPRVIVADQISRPYFPQTADEDPDEHEITNDEDMVAVRTHVQRLLEYLEHNPDLQFILLEKAYFSAMPAFVSSTVERWNKKTGVKLIPDDWPEIRG